MNTVKEEAERLLERSLSLRQGGEPSELVTSYMHLGELYLDRGQYPEALAELEEGLRILREAGLGQTMLEAELLHNFSDVQKRSPMNIQRLRRNDIL